MKCIDCGYLVRNYGTELHDEYTRELRDVLDGVSVPIGAATAMSRGWHRLHCYRDRWHGSPQSVGGVAQEINRFRLVCRTAFPYSEGSPAEHRVSHRVRTTRRWFVAGAFLGVFAIIAAALITNTPPPLDVRPTAIVTVGAASVLGLVVLAFNLLFVRD